MGDDEAQEGDHRQRRAKSFAKLIKNIEVAAKMGGADISGNPTLVDAIQKAKKTSVPNDNIDRAVKRGAGLTGESVDYETIMYEGYGPNGVALLIECLTDNKNRAAAEVRTAMTPQRRHHGRPGQRRLQLPPQGRHLVAKTDGVDEDDVMLAVLDAGAEEVADQAAASRSSPRRATWSPRAPRCRRPASTTSPPTSSSSPTSRSRSTPTRRARCSG